VEQFSDARGHISILPKMFRQSDDIRRRRPEVRTVVEHTRRIGAQAGEKRSACWITERILAVGSLEQNTSCGQRIDMWRTDQRMSVAGKVVIQIVCDNEQDVGTVVSARLNQIGDEQWDRDEIS